MFTIRLYPSHDLGEWMKWKLYGGTVTHTKRVCYRTVAVLFVCIRDQCLIHFLSTSQKKKKSSSVWCFALKQLMRGKHLKLVAAEESIHTLHSSLNVQLLFHIIKSRPICFLKTSHHVFGGCNWLSGSHASPSHQYHLKVCCSSTPLDI